MTTLAVKWQSAAKCCVALDAVMSIIAQESAKRPIGHRTNTFVVKLFKNLKQATQMQR